EGGGAPGAGAAGFGGEARGGGGGFFGWAARRGARGRRAEARGGALPPAVAQRAGVAGSAVLVDLGARLARGGPEDALAHRRRLGGDPSFEDLGAGALHVLVLGRRGRRPLDEVTGEAQIAAGYKLPRPGHQPLRATGQRRALGGDRGVGRRLEVRGIAVVPSAVQPPHVADDELGLVVDGAQVRLVDQRLRCAHGV